MSKQQLPITYYHGNEFVLAQKAQQGFGQGNEVCIDINKDGLFRRQANAGNGHLHSFFNHISRSWQFPHDGAGRLARQKYRDHAVWSTEPAHRAGQPTGATAGSGVGVEVEVDVETYPVTDSAPGHRLNNWNLTGIQPKQRFGTCHPTRAAQHTASPDPENSASDPAGHYNKRSLVMPAQLCQNKWHLLHHFLFSTGRAGVLAIFLSLSLLSGCTDKAEQPSETAKIDRAKIERIAFDFHFNFFDEALEPIELSIDEAAYFYDLKAHGKVQVGDPAGNRGRVYGKPADKNLPPRGGEPPSLAYNKTCREAGVPTPPPFGQSTWAEIGSLPGEQIFSDSRFNPLYIWRYKSTNAPAGLCAATVRYQIGKTQDKNNKAANVQVVGIICQGKKTGNACFWASETNPFGKKIDDFELNGNTIPTYTTFTNQDGSKGTKPLKCTFCHLGSNAFIVHPGTVLDGIAEEPEKRYTPISTRNVDNTNKGDKWGNPPWKKAANVIAANDCRSCHAFAEVNKVWCRDLLQKAIGKTMPPADGGQTPEQQLPKFKNSLDILKAECAKVGYDLTF